MSINRISSLATPISNYLSNIEKYKIALSRLRSFISSTAYSKYFDYNQNGLDFLHDHNLKDILEKLILDIESKNYPIFLFDPKYHRASMFKFSGTNDEPLSTDTISHYFIQDQKLLYRIDSSSQFFVLCDSVRCLLKKYNTSTLGYNGHQILEDFLLDQLNFDNFYSLIKELPVWNEIISITGHIDIIAVFYNGCKLFFLILDFKPEGEFEILRAIPQITIYGYLLNNVLTQYIPKSLNIDYEIRCIGFNDEVAFGFNPFFVGDHILKFVKYEAQMNNRRGEPILNNSLQNKLKEFFS